ncbi:MAG: sigma-70 family RNA polymerase sigma factor [Isosphaeraceae bacterium]
MTEPRVVPVKDLETPLTLLARVRQHDREAWYAFERLYKPLVYTWCRRYQLCDAEAADVAQETWVAVYRWIDRFEHGRPGNTFRGWLHQITRSKVMDFLRRKAKPGDGVGGSDNHGKVNGIVDTKRYPDPDTLPLTVESPQDPLDVYRRALEETLPELEDATREAFLRVFICKQRPAHVAADLGKSLNAVYQAKKHVLERLREKFPGFEDL